MLVGSYENWEEKDLVVVFSVQITVIPKPEFRAFGGNSLTKPPFGVTPAGAATIYPVFLSYLLPMFWKESSQILLFAEFMDVLHCSFLPLSWSSKS